MNSRFTFPRVVVTVDAEALLDSGEVPLPAVNARARGLGPGELLRIDSGFRPVPLVEALAKQGFRSFVGETAPGRFETFIAPYRIPGPPGRKPTLLPDGLNYRHLPGNDPAAEIRRLKAEDASA